MGMRGAAQERRVLLLLLLRPTPRPAGREPHCSRRLYTGPTAVAAGAQMADDFGLAGVMDPISPPMPGALGTGDDV